jgi:hypothetical protein
MRSSTPFFIFQLRLRGSRSKGSRSMIHGVCSMDSHGPRGIDFKVGAGAGLLEYHSAQTTRVHIQYIRYNMTSAHILYRHVWLSLTLSLIEDAPGALVSPYFGCYY